jgi:hypothetical protein
MLIQRIDIQPDASGALYQALQDMTTCAELFAKTDDELQAHYDQ